MKKKDRVYIFDTTLRDGEQSPGCSMNIEEKLKMAEQLELLGVDVIEAGFPIASPGDFEGVRETAKRIKKSTVAALARARKEDIDRAYEAIKYAEKPRIHTFIATSDIHMKYKLRKSRTQVLQDAVNAVKYSKMLVDDVEFSAEDATRSDMKFLCEVFQAVIEAGALVVNFPDTVGYAMPGEIGEQITQVMEEVPNIGKAVLSVHCHDDLGLAVANSIMAICHGARQVECTINGIGERAGNAALEEIVMGLKVRKDQFPDIRTGIKTAEIYKASKLLSGITGMFVQRNKAIVGENAFAHEAGIHQHGVLMEAQTYEIMTPQSVGIKHSKLVLGKHSGRHALKNHYKQLGYDLSPEQLTQIYKRFTELADKKKEIFDDDLVAILLDEVTEIPPMYTLKSLQVHSGTYLHPTATVELLKGKEVFKDSATGDGPVDAACRAVERIIDKPGRLVDYSIKSVSQGKDAMGEVHLRVYFDAQPFAGRGVSTDIIEASVRAYVDAANRALFSQSHKKINSKTTKQKKTSKKRITKKT